MILIDNTYDNEIEIRPADIHDLDNILTILDNAALWLHEIGITNQWTPGEAFVDDGYFKNSILQNYFFVALNKNEIVGAFLIRWSDEDLWGFNDDNAGYIHHLVIDRNCSVKSLGSKLLSFAEDKIRDNGKRYIRLDCIENNQKLNQYYLERNYKFIKHCEYYDGTTGNLYEK
ncbi:MAG: GNAT family N-acetyltransferase [Clostridiales bacterium]|nr:GNAT family N-acetyltransferase [Clostridiales bacterium]